MNASLKNKLQRRDPEELAEAFAGVIYKFNARERLETHLPQGDRKQGGVLTRHEHLSQKLLDAMDASQAIAVVAAVREFGILTGAPYSDATFEMLDRCHMSAKERLKFESLQKARFEQGR